MYFSVDDYYPPEWSAPPSHHYFFQVIKQGNLLGKLQVKKKPFNLIGRLQDLCDIYINNPLVSRKHAILQAKENDNSLYLMDLGSQHGTFVNKVQLPPQTYKKLQPFDSIKFGVSSRVYILRCPQYEAILENQDSQKENQFAKLLEEQHRQLSKEEMKAKYLDLLQNDPYFAANQAPKKLLGRQQEIQEDEYAGIDWGITDQRQIYAYKNNSQYPLEPDVLRRLNLDSTQLTKLSQYEDSLRNYQDIQSELNQMNAKQKRQFGLEQKLRGRKEKLEKKFVESLQSLQKNEDWLRANLFGEVPDRNKKNILNIRQKENDTFGDDVFLDRTLQKKQQEKVKQSTVQDVEVYWVLEAKLKAQCLQLQTITKELSSTMNKQRKKGEEGDQEDELDAYMKQTQLQVESNNKLILKRQMQILQQSINQIKIKLKKMVGEGQLNRLLLNIQGKQVKNLQQEYAERQLQQKKKKQSIRIEQSKSIQDVLNRLQQQQQNQQEVDQQNVDIFKYYRPNSQEDAQPIDQEQHLTLLRNKRQHYDPSKFSKPLQKVRKGEDGKAILDSGLSKNQIYEQDEQVDLTQRFK